MVELRLTRLVKGGGCARKLPAEELVEVLAALPGTSHPWLGAETGAMDDAAGVYPSDAGLDLMLTVDVITPIVDDLDPALVVLPSDAQTNGGLLLGLPAAPAPVAGLEEGAAGSLRVV